MTDEERAQEIVASYDFPHTDDRRGFVQIVSDGLAAVRAEERAAQDEAAIATLEDEQAAHQDTLRQLAAQATQIEALRRALEPFGDVGEAIDVSKFGQVLFGDSERAFKESECGCQWMVDSEPRELIWLHFRRARAALEMSGGVGLKRPHPS